MPTYNLMPHPDYPPLEVTGVEVQVFGGRRDLMLHYQVKGIGRLIMSPPVAPQRQDGLWQTTCFELFLRCDDDGRYIEFNFSPSTCWAAYHFAGHRDGMTPLGVSPAPMIERWTHGMEVNCDPGELSDDQPAMGLSAVIEEEGGVKSYWALAHAAGPPDFHNPACFAARLPAPDRV